VNWPTLVLMDGPYYEATAKPEASKTHSVQLPQRFGPPLVADEPMPLAAGDEPGVSVAELPPLSTFEVLWLSRKRE
jgi:hypothetical protein